MILILDEFDRAGHVTELDDDVIKAINNGDCMAYRFIDGKIQQYDGDSWVDIEKFGS